MAIDTAQKRRSVLSFARMNYGERVPQATDFDTGAERGQLMFLYAGLDPAAPSVSTGTTKTERFWFFFRRRR